MHPVKTLIEKYERMRREFGEALNAAGGEANIILAQPEWVDVMSSLVANNIQITATYLGTRTKFTGVYYDSRTDQFKDLGERTCS
jgi:hypothetical protein